MLQNSIFVENQLRENDLKNELPDITKSQAAQKVRHKVNSTISTGSLMNGCCQQCHDQRNNIQCNHSNYGKLQCIYKGISEFGRFKHFDIVLKSYKSIIEMISSGKVSSSPPAERIDYANSKWDQNYHDKQDHSRK